MQTGLISKSPPRRRRTLLLGLSTLIAASLFAVLLLVMGRDPLATYWAMAQGAFGTWFGVRETLIRATPVLLCALAAAVPARAGLLNLGGEGQLHVGAIATTAIALLGPRWPPMALLPTVLLGAAVAGGLWGLLPGLLRARWGINEILTSLMLNYIAIYLLEYLVHGPLKDPHAKGWPYSARLPGAAVLPTWDDSNLHAGLLIALIVSVLLYVLYKWTSYGFAIRVIEANPRVAHYVGIKVSAYIILLMCVGGAVAALAGLGEVSVVQGRLRSGISPGYGYAGFLVAWLANNHLLAIVPTAIVVGGLYSGADALQLGSDLPAAATDLLMGLIFAAVLTYRSLAQPSGDPDGQR